jgi:hypothetical protein
MELGKALEKAQLLETAMGNALLAFDALETGSFLKPDADAYLRLRDAIDHQTLGRSLKKMQRWLNVPEDPESFFSRALEARNFLVHHLIRHYGVDLLNQSKHPEIVAHITRLERDMDTAYAIAERVTTLLMAAIEDLRRKRGIDA